MPEQPLKPTPQRVADYVNARARTQTEGYLMARTYRDAFKEGYEERRAEDIGKLDSLRSALVKSCGYTHLSGHTYVKLNDVMEFLSKSIIPVLPQDLERLADDGARAFMEAYHGRDLWDEIHDDDELTPRSNTLRAVRAVLALVGVPQEPEGR